MTEVNRVSGEQGNQWIKLNTDIGAISQNQEWVRIIIEAVVGAGVQGRIKLFFFSLIILSFQVILLLMISFGIQISHVLVQKQQQHQVDLLQQ